MELNPIMPYVLGILSGLGFGAIAWRAGRSHVLWGVGGAIFGLTTATIVVGIGHAITLPYSDEVIARYYWTSVLLSALLIGIVAAVCMFLLKRADRRAGEQPVAG